MDTSAAEHQPSIDVPQHLVHAAIGGLRSGADAVLDRDWDCYSLEERSDAERYAKTAFLQVADELERLLDGCDL